MKPTFQLLFGFVIIVFTTSCQSASLEMLNQLRETKFPSFEEIYTHVNRQIEAPGKDCQFGLAKKADGYYLKIIPYNNGKIQDPIFIKAWDANTKKHLNLEIDKYLDFDFRRGTYQNGLKHIRNSAKSFELNYLYGYPNYTKELVKLMEDREDLSNKEIEMLARAYSAEACDYIHPNQFGNEIDATKDLNDPMYGKIAADRIASFNRLSAQSLACYQKIKSKDPNYKTMLFDDINLKISHDCMNNYMLLKSVREDDAATQILKKVNYNADAIAYAKQLLDNCTQNGVLMTSGDSDTFPLWYVQDQLHYRTDVLVINHSLLQIAWYFDYIKHITPIKSSLKPKEYDFYSQNYLLLTHGPDVALNYSDWLAQLRMNNPEPDSKNNYYQENMLQISEKLILNIQGTTIDFTADKGYLSGVELAMLDLISSNPERRFYTTSPNVFAENNLKDYLVKRDLVYELGPVMNASNWDKESNQRLLERLQKHPIQTHSSTSSDVERGTLYPICYDWILLPEEEIKANQPAFELFLKQLPFKTILESSDIGLIELYTGSLIHMVPKKAAQFLDSYAPKALKLIASIDEQGILSNDDMEILSCVYSSYIGFKRKHSGTENPIEETVLQKKVADALKKKIHSLCDNPLNIRNLSWTYDKLELMKSEMLSY
ncbi:hypothetical protein [Fluviicola chungangensis]|uniref:Uncharacterized protein n=1 Tax=Fluviicola chungangensis TaxID=2597671 RepID=A0A556MMN8_9FLAO|nr:hypothetical protein [Fluviicola chungangensis]TSJ41217.1 hypothetical protein FO442_15000 [Fluviicola chungangensis]